MHARTVISVIRDMLGPEAYLRCLGAFEFSIEGDSLPRGETGTKDDIVMVPIRVRLDQSVSE